MSLLFNIRGWNTNRIGSPFHHRGLEYKSGKSTDTWSSRQVWHWSAKWSRANHKRVSSKEHTAAAAAKSLQSCLTLCDPIDGSSPGSPIPGILQARTLEWVVISFSHVIANTLFQQWRPARGAVFSHLWKGADIQRQSLKWGCVNSSSFLSGGYRGLWLKEMTAGMGLGASFSCACKNTRQK